MATRSCFNHHRRHTAIIVIIVTSPYDDGAGVLHDNAEQAVVAVGLPVRRQQQAHHHQRPNAPYHLHHQVGPHHNHKHCQHYQW